MDHRDHVNLLRQAVPGPGGEWADLGSGEGAFTLALRELIGPEGQIWSIDKDQGRLAAQRRHFHARFPDSNIHFLNADFSRRLPLPPVDGLVMANSLHFVRDKAPVLRDIHEYLKPNGRLILVEYNVDSGNIWVPHPLSFETFRSLAPKYGFSEPRLVAVVPSRFLRQIYSALAFKQGDGSG